MMNTTGTCITLMMAYRTSHHETTGATPSFQPCLRSRGKTVWRHSVNLPSGEVANSHGYAEALKECIQHAYQRVRDHSAIEQKKQKANYDRFTQENTFENGSLVWLHCPAVPQGKSPKFHHPWQGPFKVVKKIGSVVYRVCKTQGNELLYMPTVSRDTTVRERMNTLKRTSSSCQV